MEKTDFKKLFKAFYSPKPGKPEIVTMPPMQFLTVSGQGDPNTEQSFQDAIAALYGTVYGLKFTRKKEGIGPDFSVGALEGIWWTKTGKIFEKGQPADWLWTIMIWLPDYIAADDVEKQLEVLKTKKSNPALDKVKLGKMKEGQSVQIMHIGPYDTEQPDVDFMHQYAKEHGYVPSGKHHEIYLGDPRRTAPEKLRTILRHPVTLAKS